MDEMNENAQMGQEMPLTNDTRTEYIADCMAQPFFTNAPCSATFIGGDPEVLREVKAVKLSIGGNDRLGDSLNDSLVQRKHGIYGFPMKKEVFQFSDI